MSVDLVAGFTINTVGVETQVFSYSNYRLYLKDILAMRQAKNPSYSLRAMARALGMSPALLSAVNKGKRNLSMHNAVLIASKLGLKRREADYFTGLVEYEIAKTAESKLKVEERLKRINHKRSVQQKDPSLLEALDGWHFIPILALTTLSEFKLTPLSASKRLGLTVPVAKEAIDKLTDLGLLTLENNYWRLSESAPYFKSEEFHSGLQNFHRRMLQKVSDTLKVSGPEERVTLTETLAFDESELEEAKTLAANFAADLVQLAVRSPARSRVYHLNLNFIPLTERENRRGGSCLSN